MTDKYGKVIKNEELAEFNVLINDLIPKVVQIADKYNIDHDKMIRFTAYTLITISGPTT